MAVNEVLQFIDALVFERTGKHLDDVQMAVVQGTWERETYDEIAQKCHVTKNHASDVGAELWQLLSDILSEDIKKSNFRSTLERVYIQSSDNSNIFQIKGNHNYFCNTHTLKSNKNDLENDNSSQSKSSYHDLTLAPKIIHFYDRETELKTLSNWIFNQNTHLISVLGFLGMGKTTLVKRFIDLNLQQFEVIIWRSLKFPQSLDLLLDDLLNRGEQEPKNSRDDKLKQLLDSLIDKKCLIILDDVQNLFMSNQLVGHYKPEYYPYQNLFKMISESEHQSHFILISQERCAEMSCLDEELYPIKCLELSGIEDPKMLNHKDLKDEDSWLTLINLYEGNPFYIKDITILIKDIFDGNVSEFLAENKLIISKTMQFNLKQLFNRLSSLEQQIIVELSQFDHPLSREEIRETLGLSSSDLINGLQSLQERYLITKINQDKVLFKVSPIFKEYVINFCISSP